MPFSSKYKSGQVIHHKKFGYRGVIISVDDTFAGTDEWYEKVAKSSPPKNSPWYQVLVHDSTTETYVAERNLELDDDGGPVKHPLVPIFFDELEDGCYIRNRPMN